MNCLQNYLIEGIVMFTLTAMVLGLLIGAIISALEGGTIHAILAGGMIGFIIALCKAK